MKNYRVAFNFLYKDDHTPVGYKYITCSLIFDIIMDLTRKDRYVDGWHLTNPPSSMIYVSVVICYSVILSFLISALNGLDILSGDIQNSYLSAPTNKSTLVMNGNMTK